jgi:hypothetical protein
MKQLLLMGMSLIAVSACAMQQPPPPPPAVAQPAAASSVGSPTNTTTAFDGDYDGAYAKNMTPGCPNLTVAPFGLVIRNGFAQFQGAALTFQGYVNPQGALSMVSQGGPTFQGQIDPSFVLNGHAAGPNCAYDLTWHRITPFRY